MIQTRKIGDATVTRIQEMAAPAQAPEFWFPAVPPEERSAAVEAAVSWLAPAHYVPHMQRFVSTMQMWLVQAGGSTIFDRYRRGQPQAARRGADEHAEHPDARMA